MPIGVIGNCISVLAGGVIGSALGHGLPNSLKEHLPTLFGMCSIAIGINSIIKAVSSRELDGAHHCIHADSYRGNYFFSFYNEDDEEQSAKIFEYAIKDDRLTPVAEYNIDGSNALSIDRNGILYAMDPFDVYCYDLNSSDPEEPLFLSGY